MQTQGTPVQNDADQAAEELAAYEPPAVVTYTNAQLLEALGPAQAGRRYDPPG